MEMKKIFLALLSFLTISCSTLLEQPETNDKIPPRIATEELDPYIRLFTVYAAIYKVKIDTSKVRVYFVDMKYETQDPNTKAIGICERRGDKINILIRPGYWFDADSMDKEMTAFHELGHCVLNLKHDITVDQKGVPISLMYPVAFDSRIYYLNYRRYVKQLFDYYKNNKKLVDNYEKACERGSRSGIKRTN